MPDSVTQADDGLTFFQATVRPSRKGTARATKPACRARIAHTSNGGRRLDLFLTAPLYRMAGFKVGGSIAVGFAVRGDVLAARLRSAHTGSRLHVSSASTSTARLCITTTAIAPSICAPVREVPVAVEDGALLIALPGAWAAPSMPATEAA